MQLLIAFALVAATVALPQGYNQGVPANPLPIRPGGFGGSGGGGGGGAGGYGGGQTCGDGQVLHVDGTCATPEVSRNIFVYAAPRVEVPQGPAPYIPPPKVDYNIVFIRTPEGIEGADPVVVPPPQQKTLVYVLNKRPDAAGPQLIEIPAPPQENPEVFFVNYGEGENPSLPGGISLQEALGSAATQQGNVIGGTGSTGGFSGSSGGFGGFGGSGGFGGHSGGFGGSSGGGGGISGGYSAPGPAPAPPSGVYSSPL